MAAMEQCAYEIFDGRTEVDGIDVEEKVKGYSLRGKNYTISQDGLCPRCGNSNKLYVILDKLFPMGDMPEILHSLIAKGRAILWSSQEKEGFKDPPTFMCRGFCPPDPLGAGFNVNWDRVSLEEILESMDKPMAATLPSSQQESCRQDEGLTDGTLPSKSWVVLDECEDEQSDIEKNISETSLNQSSSDQEAHEETEKDDKNDNDDGNDDDDDELDEEELIKQMLAKEQQKLEQQNGDKVEQDDSSKSSDLEDSVTQISLSSSSTISTTTTTATSDLATSSSSTSQYPVSTNGQCPYCQSADVKYIIIISDSTKDAELPASLQELLKRNHAFKMAKGTSEPPSFQCQNCQYGFNLDWCKTNLEVIFGLPPPTSSSASTATAKPAVPSYQRPPAPYIPPTPYTSYPPPKIPPPMYPPPVGIPPMTPPSPYHGYPPTYPGYYGYYPPSPMPPPPVLYPGYPAPGIPPPITPPPGVPPPGLSPPAYPPSGVPPIPPPSIPPPNPWGTIPTYPPGMFPMPPRPPRPYQYPPVGRPRPPLSQYQRPPGPRPSRPWYQTPQPPAAAATVPAQEEPNAVSDGEGEKNTVAAARFELLLNQIDRAKARVRHEKELIKEFQKEVAGQDKASSQPSDEEPEPNALTDEGQKNAEFDEKPPGDDSEDVQGIFLGFASKATTVEPSEQTIEMNSKGGPAETLAEEHSSQRIQDVTSEESATLTSETVGYLPISHDTIDQPDKPSNLDISPTVVESDAGICGSSQSSALPESETDSQYVSTGDVTSSPEPCTEVAGAMEALPRRGRRRKEVASLDFAAVESSRWTRRSRRTAVVVTNVDDTDSTATEEETLPTAKRLPRKSKRNKPASREEAEPLENISQQENENQVVNSGSDVGTGESLNTLNQSSAVTETEAVLDNSTEALFQAGTLVLEFPSIQETITEVVRPEGSDQATSAEDIPSESTSAQYLEELGTSKEDIRSPTLPQSTRKTRMRKRKEEPMDQEESTATVPSPKRSRRNSTEATAGELSRGENKVEADEIGTESGRGSSTSEQHKEPEPTLRSTGARPRRSRRPVPKTVKNDKEALVGDEEPPEKAETPQHKTTEEPNVDSNTQSETTTEERNSAIVAARPSSDVNEQTESRQMSDPPVSSEVETVKADQRTTRRSRRSGVLKDGPDVAAAVQITNSRPTRKSGHVSQEAETLGTKMSTCSPRAQISQSPETSEGEGILSTCLMKEAAHLSQDSLSYSEPAEAHGAPIGHRKRKVTQLSSEEPQSSASEEISTGRRTRRSMQEVSKEPKSSDSLEGISSRRRTRKSAYGGDGSIHGEDETASQEPPEPTDVLGKDTERDTPKRIKEDTTAMCTRTYQKPLTVIEGSSAEEDLPLDQDSDRSNVKEPSNKQLTTARTRKSRKSCGVGDDSMKIPIQSSGDTDPSGQGALPRRTRKSTAGAVEEPSNLSQESDDVTSLEETEKETSGPQKKVRKTVEATETVSKRMTRASRRK